MTAIFIVWQKPFLWRGVLLSFKAGRFGPAIDEMSAFENRIVKTNNPQPWKPRQGHESRRVSDQALAKLETLATTSFLVIKDEQIWCEQYWPPTTQHTVINSFSVAKSIVSTLVGIAIHEGLLQLDDPVARHLESFQTAGKEEITIEHLLRMTSGLRWLESEGAFSHNAEAYYGDSLDNLITNLAVRRPPGQVYRYASGNTQVLAMVLEKVTKMTLSRYASLKLWSVVGAEDNAYWNLDRKNGREKAFCCFYATARDFAKIGQLYLNNGYWQQGHPILPQSFITQSLQAKPMPDIWLNQTNRIYGMHWWLVQHAGYDFFYARGIRGQYIICNRELNLIIVRLGHRRNPVDRHTGHPPDLFDHINAGLEIIMSSPTIAP